MEDPTLQSVNRNNWETRPCSKLLAFCSAADLATIAQWPCDLAKDFSGPVRDVSTREHRQDSTRETSSHLPKPSQSLGLQRLHDGDGTALHLDHRPGTWETHRATRVEAWEVLPTFPSRTSVPRVPIAPIGHDDDLSDCRCDVNLGCLSLLSFFCGSSSGHQRTKPRLIDPSTVRFEGERAREEAAKRVDH